MGLLSPRLFIDLSHHALMSMLCRKCLTPTGDDNMCRDDKIFDVEARDAAPRHEYRPMPDISLLASAELAAVFSPQPRFWTLYYHEEAKASANSQDMT